MARDNSWVCINNDCGHILGEVIGGEFQPASDVCGDHLKTRGPNLVVACPNCDTVKVWYTADPLNRAIHQLIDTTVSVIVKRAVPEISREMHRRMGDQE